MIHSAIDISHYMLDEDSLNLVVPGDLITSEEGYMNGHGTYRVANNIYSCLMGTVETTNKLIIVNPLRSKYSPQIGDIVVGYVQQIANKRWKININASSFAYLSLNSTYIPQLRKKNEEDEFNMRKIMREGDLVVAEVHSSNNDGTFSLHTRNPKYGRLEAGKLISVGHRQIKRQKHHMVSINSLGVILGNNGNIFISNFKRNETTSKQIEAGTVDVSPPYNAGTLAEIAVLSNIISVLGSQGLQISEVLLKDLINFVSEKGISTKDILKKDGPFREQLLDRVRMRIPKRIQQIANTLKKH